MADDLYLIKRETLTGIADALRSGLGDIGPIPGEELEARTLEVVAMIGTGGGGSSEDVRYVTFMSHDGAVELGKKAVAVGDDCADPIARGVFDTPTKESTAQYNYTFAGWATVANGSASSSALKSVTEDRVVYAAYKATVREYMISYYDGDTLLKSEPVAYGSVPTYKPTKDGYVLVGWEPSLVAVTGEAVYYAKWSNDVSFSTAPFDTIRAVLESGQASSVWAKDDKRQVPITLYDGTVLNANFSIRSVAADYVIIVSEAVFALSLWCNDSNSHSLNNDEGNAWPISHIRDVYNENILGGLPSDMQGLVAPRTHLSRVSAGNGSSVVITEEDTTDRVWIPSNAEMSGQFFTSNAQRIKYQQTADGINQTAVQYCTRDMRDSKYWRPSCVGTNGSIINSGDSSPYSVNYAPIAIMLSAS